MWWVMEKAMLSVFENSFCKKVQAEKSPFSYPKTEAESKDVLVHLKNFRMFTMAIEALTPVNRTFCIKTEECVMKRVFGYSTLFFIEVAGELLTYFSFLSGFKILILSSLAGFNSLLLVTTLFLVVVLLRELTVFFWHIPVFCCVLWVQYGESVI